MNMFVDHATLQLQIMTIINLFIKPRSRYRANWGEFRRSNTTVQPSIQDIKSSLTNDSFLAISGYSGICLNKLASLKKKPGEISITIFK